MSLVTLTKLALGQFDTTRKKLEPFSESMHALKAYDNRSGNTQWKSYTCQNFITLTKIHLPGKCLSKIKDVLNVKVHLKLRHLFNFQGRYHRTTEYKHTEDYLKRKTMENSVRCFFDWPPCS